MGPIFLDPVEAFWILTNLAAAAFTVVALLDAWKDRASVKRGNGRSLAIMAGQAVRSEALNLAIQLLLLAVVLPGVFIDRPIPLSPPVLALMAVPVLLMVNSGLDVWDRHRLNRARSREIIAQRLAQRPPGRA